MKRLSYYETDDIFERNCGHCGKHLPEEDEEVWAAGYCDSYCLIKGTDVMLSLTHVPDPLETITLDHMKDYQND